MKTQVFRPCSSFVQSFVQTDGLLINGVRHETPASPWGFASRAGINQSPIANAKDRLQKILGKGQKHLYDTRLQTTTFALHVHVHARVSMGFLVHKSDLRGACVAVGP